MDVLKRHHWPGNIRELQNVVERAVIMTVGSVLNVPITEQMTQHVMSTPIKTLADAERAHITTTLRETNWVVGGQRGAAARLGVPRTTLVNRMQRLGISSEKSRRRAGQPDRPFVTVSSARSHASHQEFYAHESSRSHKSKHLHIAVRDQSCCSRAQLDSSRSEQMQAGKVQVLPQTGSHRQSWTSFLMANCDALFQTALLLTADSEAAEESLAAAIEGINMCRPPDEFDAAELHRSVAMLAIDKAASAVEPDLAKARSLLQIGLWPVLQIERPQRACLVLRMFLGYRTAPCAQALGIDEGEVRIMFETAMLQLSSSD